MNKTLKNMMKELSLNGNYKWLNMLPKIVDIYKYRKHRIIGMEPSQFRKKVGKQLLDTVCNEIKIAYTIKNVELKIMFVFQKKGVFARNICQTGFQKYFV